MKKYQTDIHATNWPLCESPFFYDLIKQIDLTQEERDLMIQFHEKGFVVLDLGLSDEQLTAIRTEIDDINSNESTKTQDERYHYSKGKRIFEGWKQSKLLRDLTTRGIRTYVKDLEDALLEVALMDSNEGFVTEAGDIEKWAGKGVDTKKMTEDLQEYIQKIKDHINL